MNHGNRETKIMEARKPAIWVANDGGHPYAEARALVGDLVIMYLTRGRQPMLRVDRMTSELAEKISRCALEDDYLIVSGTPMLNALVVSLWLFRFGKARILQWNAVKKCYELSDITETHMRDLLDREMRHG